MVACDEDGGCLEYGGRRKRWQRLWYAKGLGVEQRLPRQRLSKFTEISVGLRGDVMAQKVASVSGPGSANGGESVCAILSNRALHSSFLSVVSSFHERSYLVFLSCEGPGRDLVGSLLVTPETMHATDWATAANSSERPYRSGIWTSWITCRRR